MASIAPSPSRCQYGQEACSLKRKKVGQVVATQGPPARKNVIPTAAPIGPSHVTPAKISTAADDAFRY